MYPILTRAFAKIQNGKSANDELLQTNWTWLTWPVDQFDKTRVLLCKRLSGQCRDVYMVVYFHLHWWWWAVVDCTVLHWAVLGCAGLYWSVLVCTRLNWAVVGCSRLYCGVMDFTGRSQQLISVYSAIFGMVTNNQPNKQLGDPRESLLPTSVRRQSFAKNTAGQLAM